MMRITNRLAKWFSLTEYAMDLNWMPSELCYCLFTCFLAENLKQLVKFIDIDFKGFIVFIDAQISAYSC